MKSVHVFLAALFFIAVKSYSQVEVNQITHNSKERYITTTIGFPVQGTYAPIGMKEPVTVLNPDGTGFIQADDLSKKKINWGIECSEEGVAIFKEGFNSKSYTFWYRPNDSNEWYYSQFSIHFAKKKMFLMGERVKAYEDYNVQ
ncbi:MULTISPECIES: hypothetical protein [Flavobacterium]|jgi:hypothetical protein|uniref:Uncharacterized protein n=1 Tax=Flavobacterium johnsoniae (strain ATCC 17061 / DSM 2064 / JCM 8514 / BCRC 14874 / CCUG 350202 / NBRC 14942 / NCIMB 11054 / UW101) TaxID=376686 RepID=A5FAN7_FLAJ1|nr:MULTISPECIES: hypothetical protein [Flavobacterium]ABQ07726.1 hypothetical protein Fjoh_4727 [Flavobacterium johnsoniae UW101]OXG01811.1 hypothetical protein B0A63_03895 [Flavobacterium johnsoniae UW101]WDF58468.1 hypothetical protein PQ462_17285 [Flavobacterium sp. KACC 22758]WQG80435.1 hypothetical protein SR927_20730 [Flavobacterium johnsoniae UW101]SHL04089.1 hypothetical protein SAMN05444146_2753 [Flavobacterium johnsoniae]